MPKALFETLQKVNESSDYYAALDYSLTLQLQGYGSNDDDALRIPLGEVEVHKFREGRVYRLEWQDYHLRAEADHRGPGHGVDAWVSEGASNSPDWVIEDIEVERGVSDDD